MLWRMFAQTLGSHAVTIYHLRLSRDF